MRVADTQVHHGCRQVASAAATAQVSVASAAAPIIGVEWRRQWRGEVQVAEVREGATRVQKALVVGQTGVRLRGGENAAVKGKKSSRQSICWLLASGKS